MKKGTKIFVFITAMLLTFAGLKAARMHRMGYAGHGACHSENMQQHHGMKDCHPY